MHILKANVNGSPNVGLFGYATDTYALFGEHVHERLLADISAALHVPLHHAKIAGTGMLGIFLAGNERTLLVPGIAFDTERANLDRLGITYQVFETKHTCLGNNIIANDRGAILSTEFTSAEAKRIGEALGVPVVQTDIAGLNTPGAVIRIRGDKGVIHRDATPSEIALVEETLGVTLEPATVNLGTPYLNAGVLNNTHGIIIGDQSGGPELVHLDDALGYLEDEE